MLLELHIIQNHAPANLNRDETGSPKSCLFGGVQRARISSQALKRAIRRSPVFDAVLTEKGIRTRQLPEKVREAFLAAGYPEDVAKEWAIAASGFGKKDGKPETPNKDTGEILTAQTMFLSPHDIDRVAQEMLARAAAGKKPPKADEVKELQQQLAGFRSVTPDIALFGRMVTSPAFHDVEAAIQTAHAISTHRVDNEFDFFTAVDDLQDRSAEQESDAGADMMGDIEFNSACFYKYFSIHVDGLVANLTGERLGRPADQVSEEDRQRARELAGAMVEAFVKAACTVTPTGKQNTFASHTLPALVLVEARPHATPVSYANAFADPVRPDRERGGLVEQSLKKFVEHVRRLTEAFNLEANGRWLLAPEHKVDIDGVEPVTSLQQLARRAGEAARHG
ncbi:MAG: type I-E CRISPR-associated protein Cas7/Cse4/CasC [Dehalococcoidia bacterium]|nr:MAG: type I-E CRISPR-associated protein Cas7/Cse4/CasC [Dehalococcoidia bacterium]